MVKEKEALLFEDNIPLCLESGSVHPKMSLLMKTASLKSVLQTILLVHPFKAPQDHGGATNLKMLKRL